MAHKNLDIKIVLSLLDISHVAERIILKTIKRKKDFNV